MTASSATIAWVGDEYGVGTVEYGETLQLGTSQSLVVITRTLSELMTV